MRTFVMDEQKQLDPLTMTYVEKLRKVRTLIALLSNFLNKLVSATL